MDHKIVLQVDGGGILGTAPAQVLARLEADLRQRLNRPTLLLRELLQLCSGTSTGAIITGLVAAGVPADKIHGFYTGEGVRLFDECKYGALSRWTLTRPKFRREDFLAVLDRILRDSSAARKAEVRMAELPSSLTLMVTAYNLCSHRTHFIKSTDDGDGGLPLRDAIAWSALSAAFYFGKIAAPDYAWTLIDNATPPRMNKVRGAVFQDGGQGTQNCTLDYVLTEILANDWGAGGEPVVVISLGTGAQTPYDGYDRMHDVSDAKQTFKFLLNQARDEATSMQELAGAYVAAKRKNIQVFRLDYEAAENYGLDDTSHMAQYAAGAQSIIASKPYADLVDRLVALVG